MAVIKHRILLAGLGQLGSRYLQGLLNSFPDQLEIEIIEPSETSFESGISLANGLGFSGRSRITRVFEDEVGGLFDLCIVATTSRARVGLVKVISSRCIVKNWILEKVLAQSVPGLDDLLRETSKSNAWVNTPRRMTSLYSKLKGSIDPKIPVELSVKWPQLGLGCNAIHFLDLIEWLSESNIETLNILASTGWFDSKRLGYLDFDGILDSKLENGSELRLNTFVTEEKSIQCRQGETLFVIDESTGFAWDETFFAGKVEFQSELVGSQVKYILNGSLKDRLPTLPVSVDQHKKLFSAIQNCVDLKTQILDEIPIT